MPRKSLRKDTGSSRRSTASASRRRGLQHPHADPRAPSISGESDTIVRDLSELEGGEIGENLAVDCLLSGSRSGKTSLKYIVDEGRELIITIADLSEGDIDASISIVLHRGSTALVNLASVCPAGRRKVFKIDTIHVEGKTTSRVRMAGINAGNGTQLFYGTSDVHNGAHQSKTRQEGRITNLSPGSKSEVSPSLLIKDDEVDASHGAALGAYDPEAMYYMMSRGLTEMESRKLITLGSMNFVIDSMADRELAQETGRALEALQI